MEPNIRLICPQHKSPLSVMKDKTYYKCDSGCQFEIRNQIPRFVPLENYASGFGLQWNTYRRTQLDSFTGIPISAERLKRIAGGTLEMFQGKTVLEAGCGAGRFTEIMLDSGANVWAVDLSTAVDANYENCHNKPGYTVCQADILSLPFAPGQFDIVVCIGTIQHTPSPEKTIQALCSQVKPGGLLLIDHYTYGYPVTFFRKHIRKFLLNKDETFSMRFVQLITNLLWPFHVVLYKARKIKGVGCIQRYFIQWSPVVDYQDAYPALGSKLLYQWAVLDTHDTLTDQFKHLRSADELQRALKAYGMTDIQSSYAGNGVEARARKLE
jgi:SAM-dependent methyltransferase